MRHRVMPRTPVSKVARIKKFQRAQYASSPVEQACSKNQAERRNCMRNHGESPDTDAFAQTLMGWQRLCAKGRTVVAQVSFYLGVPV